MRIQQQRILCKNNQKLLVDRMEMYRADRKSPINYHQNLSANYHLESPDQKSIAVAMDTFNSFKTPTKHRNWSKRKTVRVDWPLLYIVLILFGWLGRASFTCCSHVFPNRKKTSPSKPIKLCKNWITNGYLLLACLSRFFCFVFFFSRRSIKFIYLLCIFVIDCTRSKALVLANVITQISK